MNDGKERGDLVFSGILNVYKEAGYTSNDVIARLRGILRQRKIGHAGTLDPAAVGVLPTLLGNATKISEYMMDHEKTYEAVLFLGVRTDTQDMTGQILSSSGVNAQEAEVREAVLSFLGGYDQVPPMYSAKQKDGKRLYDLAREGRVVDREAVRVKIPEIEILEISLPRVHFRVKCSKGTYIRTLCADIGEKLSCGGAMESLTRTRVGDFYIEDSLKLDEIERLRDLGELEGRIVPIEEMFLDCLRTRTIPEADRKLLNGNPLTMHELSLPRRGGGDMIRVCGSDGEFQAVYQLDTRRNLYKPYRILSYRGDLQDEPSKV